MSDPFAADPVKRFVIPPYSGPPGPKLNLIPPSSLPATAASSPASMASSTKAQTGHGIPNLPMPAPQRQPSSRRANSTHTDEFGSYNASPLSADAAQSTSAARRSSHTPNPATPNPALAPPVASSSASADHSTVSGYDPRPRQRQSHNPSATLANMSPIKPEYLTDEYVLHPSVYAFKESHPRRPMVGFGPYVLLQTLGEGEFGKVKLGVHTELGIEVAIKLIRRGSMEDEVRASKVEREVDVLKNLRHPNIVRMLDIINTEKYVGIVLEFAGGGELFDHILANRYLKERDAQKLFAQLISGVDYLHQKHIVHRDLKLENLLLDKHRNIIITDFGFANRFDHAQDDLMATSCGSPCYAAPELVISEGLYVGSAVDIWSCGVILYAMLSGYLPYDDDPANPDGDNINLLYKYIMSTRLNFPEHTSPQAKHLMQIMLVPDPDQRCKIEDIMGHPWLAGYGELFARTVDVHESLFMDNLSRRNELARRELAARRQVQKDAQIAKTNLARSQSTMPGVTTSMIDYNRRNKDARPQTALPGTTTMPEYLNNAGHRTPPVGHRQPLSVPPAVLAAAQTSPVIADAAILSPSSAMPGPPMAPASWAPGPSILQAAAPRPAQTTRSTDMDVDVGPTQAPLVEPLGAGGRPTMAANKNRHTIQVEYDGDASYERFKEMAEAKRAAVAIGGASIPVFPPPRTETSSTTPRSPPAVITDVTTSDVEMEYDSSDQDNTQEGTLDSFHDVPSGDVTPEASQVLPPTSAPKVEDEIKEEVTPTMPSVPQTPSKKAKVGEAPANVVSPSTPKATQIDAGDIATPKAPPKAPSPTPVATTPRAGGKRLNSMPAQLASVPVMDKTSTPSKERNPRLNSMGLPNPPPAGRERGRKGMSLDKFGLARLLGQASASSVDVSRPPPSSGRAAASIQESREEKENVLVKPKRESVAPAREDSDDKKTRRKTLHDMVKRSNSVRESKRPSTASTPIVPLAKRDMNPSVTGSKSPNAQLVIEPSRIVPSTLHDRGQSSPSIATVDAVTAQPAQELSHQSASTSKAKKVMDWFTKKRRAKETLSSLRTAGVRSDSTSSFVQVSNSPARKGVVDTTTVAMSSTSTVDQTAENQPQITITNAAPESATIPPEQLPLGNVLQTQQSRNTTPTSSRAPLSSAANKTNIIPPASPTPSKTSQQLLSPSSSRRSTPPLMIPARTKSLVPESTVSTPGIASEPFSVKSAMLPPSRIPIRPSSAGKPDADERKLRYHNAVVDQLALTSKPPRFVMNEAIRVLREMGIDIRQDRDNEFLVKCVRVRRRKGRATIGLGLGSVVSIGSTMGAFAFEGNASTSKLDSRGLPIASSPSSGLLSGAASGLKGMLIRRGSSYSSSPNLVRSDSDMLGSPSASSAGLGSMPGSPAPTYEPFYGEPTRDIGDEIKFTVELCRIRNLPGLYMLHIKRSKGDNWSFKILYETILERCETLTH